MRIRWAVALIFFALASLPSRVSLAEKAKVAEKPNKPPSETCTCHFGYGDVCINSMSCGINGGKCNGTCSATPWETLTK